METNCIHAMWKTIWEFKDRTTNNIQDKLVRANESQHCWERAAAVLCAIFLFIFVVFALVPIFILTIVWNGTLDFLSTHEERRGKKRVLSSASADPESLLELRTAGRKLLHFGLVTATRIGLLVLLWLPINLSVPACRDAKLLGSPLWKWSVLAAVVLLVTPAILLIAGILTTFIRYDLRDTKIIYWVQGVENNARRVLYFTAILLVWGIYFAADYNDIDKPYRPVHKYIILTIVALLVGVVLGLLNDILVLCWKSKIIYNQDDNDARIMVCAYQLYFLLRPDEHELLWILFKPFWEDKLPDDNVFKEKLKQAVAMPGTSSVRNPDSKIDVSCVWSLQDIDVVAHWLTKWIDMPADRHSHGQRSRYRQMKDETGDVFTDHLQSSTDPLQQKFNFLREELQLDTNNDNVDAMVKKMQNERYKRSMPLTNKLYEELKLKEILYVILTVVQIVFAFLVWLFITGLATTNVIVTLGSLFLGLTFVFADTCKFFFQGCVFSFVTRPLDVGDKVEIDSDSTQKLVVKRINVMATIFIEKPNGEDGDESSYKTVIYPNSELANKKITILPEGPDKKEEGPDTKSAEIIQVQKP